ncbi:MAG: hypothetical protein N4A50_01745 [Vallitalea sp.]|jgi:hypothetical protein|nr:hypothetical protein [Vallitalea sp.]
MYKKNARKRNNYRSRNKRQPEPTNNKFALKVFISMVLLLSTLYVKKYEVKIGEFNVDTIYEVLYYDEDFNELSNKVFKITNNIAVSEFLNPN